MKKKKKSGRGGDVECAEASSSSKKFNLSKLSKRVVTGGRHQFVKTPQSGSLQEGGILQFGPTVKSL